MANTSTLFGLRPVRYLNGSPWNGQVNVYYASASDTAVIYKGDLVSESVTVGNYEALGKYQTVKRAAAGEICVGVAVGFSTTPILAADPTNLMLTQRTASTAMYVFVVDDPNVIFEIQESEVTADIAAPIVAADLGANGDIVAGSGSAGSTAYGNATTGISYMCLDSTDVHAKALSAASAQLKVLRLADLPNNALGAYAKWLVIINEHLYRTGSNSTTRS